ncbi:MAG: sulfotransferase family protein [Acidimicrobiia bacterium]
MSQDSREPPFPFVVGTNGSGSTLLRAILDAHPDLAIPGPSRFIVPLARRRRTYERPAGFAQERLMADLFAQPRFVKWNLMEEEVRNTLATPPVAEYPEAVRRLFALYARRRGKSRYGDKTHEYVHHLPMLADLFPEARFVHVIRDGRDVVLAHAGTGRLEQVALSWKRRVRQGRRSGLRLGPERYREVRYERLVGETEGVVRELCGFIRLDFDERMLKYFERADEVVATTRGAARHVDLYLPPTQGLQDWRTQMTEDQVARFEAVAGDVLEELGYARAVPRPGPGVRLRAWLGQGTSFLGLQRRRATGGE